MNLTRTPNCCAAVAGHKQPDPQLYPHKFDERTFPLTEIAVPAQYASMIPAHEEIYDFMNRLFHAAALTAECGIITGELPAA